MSMNFKISLIVLGILSFPLSLFAKDLATENNNVKKMLYDNMGEIKFTKEGAAKLTHFSQASVDLSTNKEKDCNDIIAEVEEMLPLQSRIYFSLASIYCLQPANEEGRHIAKLLRISHIVESTGSEFSSKELQLFLNKYKKYTLYDQPQAYYPVDHIKKVRVISGVHSFEKLKTIISNESVVPVKNLEDFISEGKHFLRDLNLKDKEIFIIQLNALLGEDAAKQWGDFFNNPAVDVISFYLSEIKIVVNSDDHGGQLSYVAKQLLNESSFVDTRWDEFIDTNASLAIPDLENYVVEKVCVTIDTQGTDHSFYKNLARPLDDLYADFEVYHNKVSCFDFAKTYYMQHYLVTRGSAIWYGTTCRYLPYKRHEGKTLYYIGEHGQYKCPVR
ncbi:MAG: hypothetical protein HQK50_01220 [Oligoflexia bacterium]|nr:hypothetical protein [Oligoflexia bacterium]MBF0364158.1 hypothetical protein [Oligoflexia bacterium]